ncbi:MULTISPECIES: phosphate signaling complex protein PhoU [Pontibacter]|uniref:Phosphate-specific transport system accessory protein PhoU n=1 Tax=Pontibacter lucknowensis TaxID=1077936 RepID=A0A1N6U2C2_9BACT|nr:MULTISPECIES: phosphate signaling complex protein PhoU [Pontibacter]EJF11734.1 transcriptional regulator [Pontibacter sp. BAB1700]SIQ59743.1 phosphate transport system protein [Pontibacter lucknowensis]
MPHIDVELERLREKLLEMWDLVEHQLTSGREAVMNADHELSQRIIKLERKVNSFDLKIDRMCENFFALFTPVAVDLRTVLAILKINTNLERIGDTAEGMARFACKLDRPFDPELVELTNVMVMYDEALVMFNECRTAFKSEDPKLAKQIIKRDKALNKIYRKSDVVIGKYLQNNPDRIPEGLALLSIIKKLERVGDQVTNMAEEIIFYREAKVVKHRKKKKKKE